MKLIILLSFVILINACADDTPLELRHGLVIKHSVTIKKDTFYLEGADSISDPGILVEGDDIVIDFNGAVLIGSKKYDQPETFTGLGIAVRNGKNITIKNAVIKGYKVGILVSDVDSFQLLASDLSYNHRHKLKSTWEKENTEDWLSYHQNDHDEWLRYGMAVYLKNCNHAMVSKLKVTGGQNGLMMRNCHKGVFYNNDISYNSGVGIGMYRSSENRIKYNYLDWNIRGFSYGRYNRGQDSAGILLYEQCSDNIFAHNSATHSGDGFFLWAGHSTMETGKGGCNRNFVYNNNFSYASNNGIEVTFSGDNVFYKNRMFSCDYGLWGGYSYGMDIAQNLFKNNNHSIAIEHGNNNRIRINDFLDDKEGILLFERSKQPDSWTFAKVRNVASRNYTIEHNNFKGIVEPLKISDTDSVRFFNNIFYGENNASVIANGAGVVQYEKNQTVALDGGRPIKSNELLMKSWAATTDHYRAIYPEIQKQGVDVVAPKPKSKQVGRRNIIMGDYGPYNFEYPNIWLRTIEGNTYTFAVFGPFGNWKAVGGKGFKMMSKKQGAIPATLVLEAEADAAELEVKLEYIGPAFTDAFGRVHKRGQPYTIQWSK